MHDEREEFRHAVMARDAAAVRALLQRHPDAALLLREPMFSFGTTALLHVAGDRDPALIDVLLEFGADANQRSEWWAGPWHALHSATGAVADRLVAAGAIPDTCAAANLDRIDLLRRMLDEDPARVHERGGDGQTPLHFARSRAAIDLLLEYGADMDARDVDHRAAPAEWMLDHKRDQGRYRLAGYLVERGASADIFLATALGLTERVRELVRRDRTLLERRTGQGEYAEMAPSSFHIYTWTIGQNLSPIQVAIQFQQPEALEVLRSFATPKQRFLAACAQADVPEARRLLRAQPSLMEQLTADDQGVLPDAGWAGNAAAVELMLELGFDPATIGSFGGNVLQGAAWEGVVDCVVVALRAANVRRLIHERDAEYGGTALGWCCHGAAHSGNPRRNHAAVARLLLDAGAEPLPELHGVPPDVAAVIREYQR